MVDSEVGSGEAAAPDYGAVKTPSPEQKQANFTGLGSAPGGAVGGSGASSGKAGNDVSYDRNLAVILGVPVKMQVVLGAAAMPVASLLKLGRGSVVELDQKVGEPVDIMVNDRIVARGEVVVVEEERFGVTLTEIVANDLPTDGIKL
ncbi:flagellar motor switch protein FliN [Rhodospirillaceae bacterium SYSU D60014]|uniref:flagellar motor switch protein FliN n=1 Tax=Virgifigura deserti TaxID=2268457 RepID=UPI000E666651